MADHAARRVGEEPQAFRRDRLTTVLAQAIRPFGSAGGRVLRLALVLVDQPPHALTGGAVALDLSHVGFPEPLAHVSQVSPLPGVTEPAGWRSPPRRPSHASRGARSMR